MSTWWESRKLGELCTFQAGTAFPKSEQGFTSGEHPFIKVSDMLLSVNSKRIVEANNWISSETAARMRVKLIPPGAIVFAKIGEGLKNERLRRITMSTALDNNMMAAVPKNHAVDSRFLLYLMEKVRISEWAQGSALPYLSQKVLTDIPVKIPSLPEQRAIASTLGALDDKIESNHRIVKNVPSLIRSFVESATDKGSSSVSVSHLATFTNGGAYTKGASGSGRMVIRITELNSGPGNSTVFNNIDAPENKIARAGDILMAWSASLGVYRWYRDEALINQHIFKVDAKEYPAWLVFDRLEAAMPLFRDLAADKATTMGHIKREHLESTKVSIPNSNDIARLNKVLEPLWERLILAEIENIRLSKLRDTLLPELLSGRIRVPTESGEK